MFETAELGRKVDKPTYASEVQHLRPALLNVQKDLGRSDFSTIVLISGVEGSGKPEMVHLLLDWMDPRGIRTFAFGKPTPEERQRPGMWRFWMALPPTERMSIFHGSVYQALIDSYLDGGAGDANLAVMLDRVLEFEQMLASEKVLLVKFWLHLSRDGVKKRFKELSEDPLQKWRVRKEDWRFLDRYDEFREAAEHILRKTSTAAAPWNIIEASDSRYRNLTVARTLLGALQERLSRPKPAPPHPPPLPTTSPTDTILTRLDMSQSLTEKEYDEKLPLWQGRVYRRVERLRRQKRAMVLVFEGPDAAGKGGAIRRLTAAMDARDYNVSAIAAPTDEERARPYLWRFWRDLPRRGKVAVYDRSWYGRVLVERIEGFCSPEDWQRAYHEINDFEAQLDSSGIIVLKFWLAITPEEQLLRFQERKTTPYKQYKLTEEDWRNRTKWDAYQIAACDMIEKTSTTPAPWIPVEANNKEWARIKVLRTVAKRLKEELS